MSENQEFLSCRLTETERIERAKATTDLLKQYEDREELQKEHAKRASEELKSLRAKMVEAGRASREGHEERWVPVDERPNVERMKMESYRRDTGELLRTRKMTDDEVERYVQMRLVD